MVQYWMQWEKYLTSKTQRKQKAGNKRFRIWKNLCRFFTSALLVGFPELFPATFLVIAHMLLPIQYQLLQCHHFHLHKVLCATFHLSTRWFLLLSKNIRQKQVSIVIRGFCASSLGNTSRLFDMLFKITIIYSLI